MKNTSGHMSHTGWVTSGQKILQDEMSLAGCKIPKDRRPHVGCPIPGEKYSRMKFHMLGCPKGDVKILKGMVPQEL
jgi:hypothetical protein